MDYDNIDSQFGKFNCTCTHRMALSYTKQVLHWNTLHCQKLKWECRSAVTLIALDGFASKVYDVANQALGFWLELLCVCS